MRRHLLSTSAGFSISVLLTAVAQFFTFPLLIHSLGADQWASLTLGTTIGVMAAVVGGWGWPLVGAAEVAAREPANRAAYLLSSFVVRLPLTLLTLLLTTALVHSIPSPNTTATWLAAVASIVSVGLTPSWYFVGIAAPYRYFLFFSLPSLMGILTGTALSVATHDARMHASTNLAASILICVGCSYVAGRTEGIRNLPRPSRADVRRQIRSHCPSVTVGLLSTANSSGPLIAVAHWFPQHLPSYALAERLYKLALTVASPVVQAAHGQVPDGNSATTLTRLRMTLPLVTIVASGAGAIFAMMVPWSSGLYTGGHITIRPGMALGFGIALFALVLSSTVGVTGLAVTNNSRWFLRAALLGSLVCIIGVALGVALDAGSTGIALAVATAEVVVVATQLGRLAALWNRTPGPLRIHDLP